MESNKPQSESDMNEINLREVILPLWAKRLFIIRVSLIFGLIGFLFALLRTPEYTATITFIPQTSEKSNVGLGNLGGLAAMAGINLQGIAAGSEIPPTLYPKIISSSIFRRSLLESNLHGPLGQLTTYREYFQQSENALLSVVRKVWEQLGQVFSIQKSSTSFEPDLPNVIRITLEEDDLFEKLNEQLKIQVDKKENSVLMSFTMDDPLLAAQMVESGFTLLQKELIQYKVELARQQLNFIDEQYQQKKAAFEEAQSRLAAFRDQNQNLSSAKATNKVEKLEAEYNLSFTIYSEIAKQLEQARIQVSKDTPIFSVIQPVTIPLKKSSTSAVMYLFAFVVLGFFCATVWVALPSALFKNEVSSFSPIVEDQLNKNSKPV